MIAIEAIFSAAGPLFLIAHCLLIEEHNLGAVSTTIDFKLAQLNHQPEILGGIAALLGV